MYIQEFTFPGKTHVIAISGQNIGGPKGIRASFGGQNSSLASRDGVVQIPSLRTGRNHRLMTEAGLLLGK